MQTRKPNILYVDDEHYNLTVFVAAFRKYYNIFTSISAKTAMEILKKHSIALVITDQRMPEITGVQFLEALVTEYPEPVRMILTGFTDVEAIKKAINKGCILRYITKPWDEAELKQIIDMGIKLHELEQNQRLLIKRLEDGLAQNKKVIKLFQQYIREDVVDQILNLDSKELFSSHGEYRIVSALFVDIRNITKLSETLNPKDFVSFLNRYFAILINTVIKNHGFVYKLIGDGLLAIFGAPTSSIYNQRNAVFCALDIIDESKNFNHTVGKEFNGEMTIGIGISTGPSVVGHIISEQTLNNIVMGEAIDNALHMEVLTHDISNSIIIDKFTYQEVNGDVDTEVLEGDFHGELFKVIGKKT